MNTTVEHLGTDPGDANWRWKVREKRDASGKLRDCFVEAPKVEGMAYGLEVLGDDYTSYGDVEGKLEHCHRIVACVNACMGLPTEDLERMSLDKAQVGRDVRYVALMQRHDELVEAIGIAKQYDTNMQKQDREQFRALVAKVQS